mmetsp:Transcript_33809/g.80047  ORF Transcript_33809/g.80047 Transcript_33809/m.80047 type:complete len:201 (+) Transcript_33809:122-724(+)
MASNSGFPPTEALFRQKTNASLLALPRSRTLDRILILLLVLLLLSGFNSRVIFGWRGHVSVPLFLDLSLREVLIVACLLSSPFGSLAACPGGAVCLVTSVFLIILVILLILIIIIFVLVFSSSSSKVVSSDLLLRVPGVPADSGCFCRLETLRRSEACRRSREGAWESLKLNRAVAIPGRAHGAIERERLRTHVELPWEL